VENALPLAASRVYASISDAGPQWLSVSLQALDEPANLQI
jgi:hypothetical protein